MTDATTTYEVWFQTESGHRQLKIKADSYTSLHNPSMDQMEWVDFIREGEVVAQVRRSTLVSVRRLGQ